MKIKKLTIKKDSGRIQLVMGHKQHFWLPKLTFINDVVIFLAVSFTLFLAQSGGFDNAFQLAATQRILSISIPFYFKNFTIFIFAFAALLMLVFRHYNLLHVNSGLTYFDEIFRITKYFTLTFGIISAFLYYFPQPAFNPNLVFNIGVFTLCGILIWHTIIRIVLHKMKIGGFAVRRVLIYGAGEAGTILATEIERHPYTGIKIVGFIDDDISRQKTSVKEYNILGTFKDLFKLVNELNINEVFVAIPSAPRKMLIDIMRRCEDKNIDVKIIPDFYDFITSKVQIDEISYIPLISIQDKKIDLFYIAFKRIFDIVCTSIGLILISPVFIITAILIKLDSKGPIFFSQERIGKDGKSFKFWKFRSMCTDAEEMKERLMKYNEAQGPIFKMKDDPRITKIGKFIRRYSIDELPQLYNVLCGDMSLVGPRPPVPKEVAQYEKWHNRRFEVTPGITGLWQVSGRSNLTFTEMVKLDIYYIENWSLWLDIKILLKTIVVVFKKDGAY